VLIQQSQPQIKFIPFLPSHWNINYNTEILIGANEKSYLDEFGLVMGNDINSLPVVIKIT